MVLIRKDGSLNAVRGGINLMIHVNAWLKSQAYSGGLKDSNRVLFKDLTLKDLQPTRVLIVASP